MAQIWLTERVIASLVYASSRQSEGPPSSYPPTTNAVAAGMAMTSQSTHRPQGRASVDACGATGPGSVGPLFARPRSAVSDKTVPSAPAPRPAGATATRLPKPGRVSRPDGEGERAPAGPAADPAPQSGQV